VGVAVAAAGALDLLDAGVRGFSAGVGHAKGSAVSTTRTRCLCLDPSSKLVIPRAMRAASQTDR